MARETLDRSQIVSAAIELLDEEGLDGLSMRRLGQRLDSAATSMYWHVQSKENLIALASDQVWGEIPLLDPDEVGWREAAIQLARSTYELGVAHHWLMPAITNALAYGNGMARHQDHSYAIFEAAGFIGTDLDWAVNTLFNFVLGATYQDSQIALLGKSRQEGEDMPQRLREALVKADQIVAQFPRLRARAEEQRKANTDPHAAKSVLEVKPIEALEFGLSVILDGLAARLSTA